MKAARVVCRSEYEYAQRPVAVWLNGERLAVEAVEAEWRTAGGKSFRVRCAGGTWMTLIYDEDGESWFADE